MFEQDAEDGSVVVADGAGEEAGAAPAVHRAVAACPSGAISLVP
ncbi:hypothetical protein [Nocardiopsis sp. Huas11]|nr:hypothetical protein [Nocardiopsis sp. Huas11]